MLLRAHHFSVVLLAIGALSLSGCGGSGGGGERAATPPVGGTPPMPMPTPGPMPAPPPPDPQPMPQPTPEPMPQPVPMPMPPPPTPTPMPMPPPAPAPAPVKAKLDAANAETFTAHSVLATLLVMSAEGVTNITFETTPPGTLTFFQRARCNNGTAQFRINTDSPSTPSPGRFTEYDNCVGLVVNGSVSVVGNFVQRQTPERDFVGLNLMFSDLMFRRTADNRNFRLAGSLRITKLPAFFTSPPGFLATLNGTLFDADGAQVLSMDDLVVMLDTTGFGGANLRLTFQGRLTDPRLGFVETITPDRLGFMPRGLAPFSGIELIDGADQQASVTFSESGSSARLRPVPVIRTLLDDSFASGGKVLTDFDNGNDFVNALALQEDGKLLAAGGAGTAQGGRFGLALARYNPNGSLDVTFGAGGKVVARLVDGFTASDVEVQPDAKIVISGSTEEGNGSFAVARFNSDGTPDTSFGDGGTTITALASRLEVPSAKPLVLQPDGKIVGAGALERGTLFLVRRLPDGRLDESFGTRGIVTTSVSFERARLASLVLQPDGRLVLAGIAALGDFQEAVVVVRYNTDGSLDAGFGTEGKVQGPPVDFASLGGLVLQPDGSFLGAGNVTQDNSPSTVQFKLLSNGTPDPSFGDGGIVANAASFAVGRIALQANGKLVVAGTQSFGPFTRFGLLRVNPDGSLDTGFGNSGAVLTSFGNTNAIVSALLVQPDGRIVIGGGAQGDVALARYVEP